MRIEVTPREALYDEPIRIRLAGFPPVRAVSVRASTLDSLSRKWGSEATFLTDGGGEVDVSLAAPRSGSYQTADSSGLLWSMQLEPDVVERSAFAISRPDNVSTHLSAEIDEKEVASTDLVRRLLANQVLRKEIREDGLVATFFHSQAGPRPGVIVLSGSGGGLAEDQPALLASRGYAVLSLGYFLMPGLPQALVEIPLEYFARALAWMKRNPAVDADRIAVMGASRGGELSLLLGASFPDIKAVVAYVPSGVVWPGIGGEGNEPKAAWTLGGEPVAFMESAPPDPELWSKSPIPLTPWFVESLKNRASIERSSIAVEKINGPVLMFSGSDDQMWPSLNLADLAVQRMIAHDFAHPYEHVSYAGAGHFIRFPYSPTINEIFHPLTKQMMALGGTPQANHIANLDSWRRCLSFLKKFLG